MTLTADDLARCDAEPIRVPGAIQPHGYLVVLAADGRVPLAWSANWPDAAGRDAALAACGPHLDALPHAEGPVLLGDVTLDDTRHDAIAHRNGAQLIVEFLPAGAARGARLPIYDVARHALPRLQTADSVIASAEVAARAMKALTGFGRCLVYRFDADGHGEVLAEARDAGYDGYLGHRFPASDVPGQARALYLVSQFRLIPDAEYVPVPLVAADPAIALDAIDLSFAALRSVSPVHLEYMRNMGTRASMSVSIVVNGRLWGLVSCHDHAPRQLDFPTRVACEHLGRLLSLQIEAREDNAEVARRLELRRLLFEIVSRLAESDATLERIVAEPAPLLALAGAAGAAVVYDDACWTAGAVPPAEELLAIARIVAQHEEDVWYTDALAGIAQDGPAAYPGVLAISISRVHRHLILWFRPEFVRTVVWAGDPRKHVVEDGRIQPRRSFASWEELIRGRAEPWSAAEIAAVRELRQALLGIVLRRAQEIAAVATELERVNKELEAFSYTVSHDLRAPMRHIAGYVDLVLDGEGKRLSERTLRYLAHVKEASVFAGQLVDSLLDFSRMGRSGLQYALVDTGTLVADLVREQQALEHDRRIEWSIDPALPVVWADPFLLQVAVRNLVANAVKYTRSRDPARIAINRVETAAGVGLEIADNGVGFQMKYVGKLFGVFQRLHQAEEFEGTGIGLANVRRIVERHGGAVRAHGEEQRGATFGFTLPLKPEAS